MNYREATDYIEKLQTEVGSDLSLKQIKYLADKVGNPENKSRIIHIAGTNGKGSVGNFIAGILAMSGYTVGRYVSPALFDYREKIQKITGNIYGLQKEYISEQEVADNLTYLIEKTDEIRKEGKKAPTAFEIETVMAYKVFADWKVDVAIVETGMGGRLDATNIVEKPVLSVITSISMDHMDYLGDTLLAIAKEKYGIIKNRVPVVAIEPESECLEELKYTCRRHDANLNIFSRDDIRPYEFSVDKTSFIYENEKFTLSQAGIFQLDNAGLALEAAKVLYGSGFRLINNQSIKEAFKMCRWPGRFEVVSHDPYVIVDGAHNPDAARLLKYSLSAYFPGEKFIYIIGVFKDKDYEQILRTTLPRAKRVYTINAPAPRGLESEQLAECAAQISDNKIKHIEAKHNVREALSSISRDGVTGRIVVFGSLSFLHEVYEYFGKGY